MVNFVKNTPQIPVVLASLVLWVSFAWGLPANGDDAAEAPVTDVDAAVAPAADTWTCGNCNAVNDASAKYCTECGTRRAGAADVAPKNPWAGVRISDAYDYAKCPKCGKKNDIRALVCSRCGYVLPQPSAEIKDPDLVFVLGKGYYHEGELLEPAREQKWLLTTGYVLIGVGVATAAGTGYIETQKGSSIGTATGFFAASLIAVGGVPFLVIGYATRKEAVYALNGSRCYETGTPCKYEQPSPYYEGVALKVNVLTLGY
jgi:ribosomal protein L40E